MCDQSAEPAVEPTKVTCDDNLDAKLKESCLKVVDWAQKNVDVDGLVTFFKEQTGTEEFRRLLQDAMKESNFAEDSSLIHWTMKHLMAHESFNQILTRDYLGRDGGLVELFKLYLFPSTKFQQSVIEAVRESFDEAHVSLLADLLMPKEGFQQVLLQAVQEQLEDSLLVKLSQKVLEDDLLREAVFNLALTKGDPEEASLQDFGMKLLALDDFHSALVRATKANINWTE